MNKECIPYQQALELKELGFNLECGYLYNTTDDNHLPFPCDEPGMCKDWNTLYTHNTNKHLLSAPLYQQVFRWFREEHDLRVRSYVFKNDSDVITECFEIFKCYREFNETIWRGFHSTYEKAELASISKLIELIKK